MLRNKNEKTPYELWKGRPANLKHFWSTRKSYKCYNLILNKVLEIINVAIHETCRQELKEEENEKMEQLYEEEAEDEKEVEGKDEEDLTEEEQQVQQVSQKTPT